MRYAVLPYKQGSRSARALAEALGGRVLKIENSKFRPRPDDVIINWGSTRTTERVGNAKLVNPYQSISAVSNKRTFFQKVSELEPEILPPHWTHATAIPNDAFPVVCRTVLAGHSGEGIVIADTRDELVPAPLYVKYIRKQDEYRVHVGNPNTTIAVQRKARSYATSDEDIDWRVRNHKNGFVFVRNGVSAPESVISVAHRAIVATGLDFGAVDVVYNSYQQRSYVLEINSAPGLEGQTVEDYARFFAERSNVDQIN